MKTDKFITVDEACEIIGVSKPTVYKLIKQWQEGLDYVRKGKSYMLSEYYCKEHGKKLKAYAKAVDDLAKARRALGMAEK